MASSSPLPYPPSLPDTDRSLRAPPAARLARRTSLQSSLGTRTMVHISNSNSNSVVTGAGDGTNDDDNTRGTIPIALSRITTEPLSPPPPVAAPTTAKRSRFQEVRRSLWPIPAGTPLPPENPSIEVVPPTPGLPAEKALARSKTKRKTILERIEGWWDLGLVRMDTVRGRNRPFPGGRREKQIEDDGSTLV